MLIDSKTSSEEPLFCMSDLIDEGLHLCRAKIFQYHLNEKVELAKLIVGRELVKDKLEAVGLS